MHRRETARNREMKIIFFSSRCSRLRLKQSWKKKNESLCPALLKFVRERLVTRTRSASIPTSVITRLVLHLAAKRSHLWYRYLHSARAKESVDRIPVPRVPKKHRERIRVRTRQFRFVVADRRYARESVFATWQISPRWLVPWSLLSRSVLPAFGYFYIVQKLCH